ncbi:hypothetical protein QJS63_26475 [Pseudomonas juntendi]|nr:hypothetical protein QJS63_26475 [Pseudomonas juntendi]
MKSPHVLIDNELDAMADSSTPASCQVLVLGFITKMFTDSRISREEFNHYCGRLNKIVDGRKEAA